MISGDDVTTTRNNLATTNPSIKDLVPDLAVIPILSFVIPVTRSSIVLVELFVSEMALVRKFC